MIRCVLMDIEGTIISIAFVREVLFLYAQRRLTSFLQQHRDNPVVCEWAAQCLETAAQETGVRFGYDELPEILRRWIEEDRKHPGLKALQGMIWEEGYRAGRFTPELYDDVAPMLRHWRAHGLRLAVYSSGSELAQRLLLAHTTDGDLTGLFSHFFDTAVGAKSDSASYRRIAGILALPPGEILFLSDSEAELDAAVSAGLQVTQIVRLGTSGTIRHPVSSNFHRLNASGLPEAAPCFSDGTPGGRCAR